MHKSIYISTLHIHYCIEKESPIGNSSKFAESVQVSLLDKQAIEMSHSFLDRVYLKDLIDPAMIKVRSEGTSDIEGRTWNREKPGRISNIGNYMQSRFKYTWAHNKKTYCTFKENNPFSIKRVKRRSNNLKYYLVRAFLPSHEVK